MKIFTSQQFYGGKILFALLYALMIYLSPKVTIGYFLARVVLFAVLLASNQQESFIVRESK